MMLWVSAASPVRADDSAAPLNYFLHAHGPAAYPTLQLDWVLTAVCIFVCMLIAALLAMAILHKRPEQRESAIIREGNGLSGVYIGTGISIVVLFGLVIYALKALDNVATPPAAPGLVITVTGYDWWWKADYEGFSTANEIHIPVGVPVQLNLNSADVIHAFWVPQLAGKTQMIPGQTNRQWLQADEAGIYRGQCTQFCGAQHAHMAFEVVADSPADFAAWQAQQRLPVAPTKRSMEGEAVFQQQCAGCHAVRGTEANGGHGPDLTHLASRQLIAAGLLTNTPENRMDWIAHAQELKPGCRMPDFALSPADSAALSAYLTMLR